MAGWGGSNLTPEQRARRKEEDRISLLREIVAHEGEFYIAHPGEARIVNSLVRSGLVTPHGKNEAGYIRFVATRPGLEKVGVDRD